MTKIFKILQNYANENINARNRITRNTSKIINIIF
jgi:hypothetical protein